MLFLDAVYFEIFFVRYSRFRRTVEVCVYYMLCLIPIVDFFTVISSVSIKAFLGKATILISRNTAVTLTFLPFLYDPFISRKFSFI